MKLFNKSRLKTLKLKIHRGWIAGFLALLWFLIRTGTNPKRLTYPCQQAAFPIATSWLLSVFVFLSGSYLLKRFARYSGLIVLLAGVILFTGTRPDYSRAEIEQQTSLPIWEVQNPVSTVFVMNKIPRTTGSLAAGDATVPDSYLSDPAIDSLFLMLQAKNIYLHKTQSHPSGIVGSDNIAIIKGNFQWAGRNTTSTDRIKGIIWQILQHPDGFSGEIHVCDNTQDIGTGINQSDNNSEDTDQSIIDVVNTFYAKGYPVFCRDWRSFYSKVVEEYSTGDNNEGYTYDQSTRITYPKFDSPSGKYKISLRYGIWDSTSSTYDASRLCIINFPVLKAHSYAGATVAIKNWIGVLTTAYQQQRYGGWNAMHDNYLFGKNALVAKVMAVTFPKLTILDAAWVSLKDPHTPPYTQKDMLLASTDPAAISWYAAKYILMPIATSSIATDPDGKYAYGYNLTHWINTLKNAGFPCTKDPGEISVYDRDVLSLLDVETETGLINQEFQLKQNFPNPFNPKTVIEYIIPTSSNILLSVYNTHGQNIKSLVNAYQKAGSYSVTWDATDQQDHPCPSGCYFYRLSMDQKIQTRKMMIVK